jgi:hypothetical protein
MFAIRENTLNSQRRLCYFKLETVCIAGGFILPANDHSLPRIAGTVNAPSRTKQNAPPLQVHIDISDRFGRVMTRFDVASELSASRWKRKWTLVVGCFMLEAPTNREYRCKSGAAPPL